MGRNTTLKKPYTFLYDPQKITSPEAHDGRVRRGASVASIPTARATGNTPTKLGLPSGLDYQRCVSVRAECSRPRTARITSDRSRASAEANRPSFSVRSRSHAYRRWRCASSSLRDGGGWVNSPIRSSSQSSRGESHRVASRPPKDGRAAPCRRRSRSNRAVATSVSDRTTPFLRVQSPAEKTIRVRLRS